MKSRSFKSREEMISYLQEGGNYKGVPKIKKVQCGMDALVEKLHNSRMGLIEDEAEYWEMKAELHFEK